MSSQQPSEPEPTTISGTLPMVQDVDASGSYTLNVPLQLPECRLKPGMSLLYHSAASKNSALGQTWALIGIPMIQRVPATKAQDKYHGVVGYDDKDRFALDGQRLVKIGALKDNKTEYRFEIEQWSRVFAIGKDAANPASWEQLLPDGTIRKFGNTTSSNNKGVGISSTRVWAVSEISDPFTNYITFEYTNDTKNGGLYPSKLSYGGNVQLGLEHQRTVSFTFENRSDVVTEYLGGCLISLDRRLKEIVCSVDGPEKWRYQLDYDYAPLTKVSRIVAITLIDADKVKVDPLKFKWINGDPKVFDAAKTLTSLPYDGGESSNVHLIPMDVDAEGHTDMVVASMRTNPATKAAEMYLETFYANSAGELSDTPGKGAGFTGLLSPTWLFPFDANGDGRMDLLHISFQSSINTYVITILLSDGSKFQAQQPTYFSPKQDYGSTLPGTFRTGDFEGSGTLGLAYVFLDPKGKTLSVIQFKNDGKKFTPIKKEFHIFFRNVVLDSLKVLVGDLDGDGSDDMFVLARVATSPESSPTWKIYFFSPDGNGNFVYNKDNPLQDAAKDVSFDNDATVLPYRADADGKTSLLFVSKKSDNLKTQLLRSMGKSLVAEKPTEFNAKTGEVAVAKVVSQTTMDLVNVNVEQTNPTIQVFRYTGQAFEQVSDVMQPKDVPQGSVVRWADLRGVGRTDCLFSTFDKSTKKITVRSLQCSVSLPLDRIITSTNGIGASTTVTYAPLTNPKVHKFDPKENKQATASVNGVEYSSTKFQPDAKTSQETESTRSKLFSYPTFVVRTIFTNPGPSDSAFEVFDYTYLNARLGLDGRGWLGFSSITKKALEAGVIEVTNYLQEFPFIGRPSFIEKKDNEKGTLLHQTKLEWRKGDANNAQNRYVVLHNAVETYYEGGAKAYDITAAFTYDAYGNALNTKIHSSCPGSLSLDITSAYQAPSLTGSWVVGNKLTEAVKESHLLGPVRLRQTTQKYKSGTSICEEKREWIKGNTWTTTKFSFDNAGNQVKVNGPGRYREEFVYDATYSTRKSTQVYTSDTESLTTLSTYDLATSLPSEVETPNGLITQHKYDILGRKIKVSQGIDRKKLDIMERTSYSTSNSMLVETREISNGLAGSENAMYKIITSYDGLRQPLSVQKSRPDDLSSYICVDTQYDGLGRISSRSREYVSGTKTSPQLFEYSYDKLSRLIREVYPPRKSGGTKVTHELAYFCTSGTPVVRESLSDGSIASAQVNTREFMVVPNTDNPSLGNFVKLCVAKRTNEDKQVVNTTFDGLARPTSITDASGVALTMEYDGLSRQIGRTIAHKVFYQSYPFSHFTVLHDDDKGRSEVNNQQTGSKILLEMDFCGRPVQKKTTEETVTYKYDQTKLSRGLLSSVVSKSGQGQEVKYEYTYDGRGNQANTTLSLDGRVLKTAYEYTATGQLQKATNPDGSFIAQTYFRNGVTVKKLELSSKDNHVQASSTFSDITDPFALPLTRTFGNGVSSKISIFDNGMLSGDTISKDEKTLLKQSWDYDSFNKISNYTRDKSASTYKYDHAGQLAQFTSSGATANLTYDASGNIKTKGDHDFTNQGWQLKQIKNKAGNSVSYEYTIDGNLSKKTEGTKATSMTYNSEGRLKTMGGTTFLYDHIGKMLKATASNGDYVLYASSTYEIQVDKKTGKETVTSYLLDGQYRRASYATGNVVRYFHTDHLGSTVAVSDANGTIITQYTYDALGKVSVSGTGGDIARYKYCGKELFDTVYYFETRFYDPEVGRFLTLDSYPIDIDNISPAGFNLYLFCQNNSINFVDRHGTNSVPWWRFAVDAVLIGIGVVVTLAASAATGGVLAPLLLSVIGGAALGAGISGASADFSGSNGEEWGTQLGVGALYGALTVGTTAGVSVGIKFGSRALLSFGVRESFKRAGARFLGQIVIDVGIGAGMGALQQVHTNYIYDKPLGEGVGTSAVLGALVGLGASVGLNGSAYRIGRMTTRAQRASDRMMLLTTRPIEHVRNRFATLAEGVSTV